MQSNNRIEWTDERIAVLQQYYNVESNEKVAERLGISTRTLTRKAKELGLRKSRAITKSTGLDDVVRELHPDHSISEIAREVHTSTRTIQRIVNRLGLSRTKEQDSKLRSRIRTKLLKSERARIVFGLDQRTNIKLVTNPAKIRLRTKLKGEGYIVFRGNATIFYPMELKRHLIQEKNGRELGLSFAPWCPPAIISNISSLSA